MGDHLLQPVNEALRFMSSKRKNSSPTLSIECVEFIGFISYLLLFYRQYETDYLLQKLYFEAIS